MTVLDVFWSKIRLSLIVFPSMPSPYGTVLIFVNVFAMWLDV
jgi:hypothetical protein